MPLRLSDPYLTSGSGCGLAYSYGALKSVLLVDPTHLLPVPCAL